MISPGSTGADRLRDFIVRGGATVWSFDHPMDLADASLLAAAEVFATTRVFTIDRRDFQTYRIRRGHHSVKVEIIG